MTYKRRVINCSALPCLLSLLSSVKGYQKKHWTISNITAGNSGQIQAVREANIIPPLIHLLQTAEFDIKKEAAWDPMPRLVEHQNKLNTSSPVDASALV